jgi:hypothetical protein
VSARECSLSEAIMTDSPGGRIMRGMGICFFGEERMVSDCEELEHGRELERGSLEGFCMTDD